MNGLFVMREKLREIYAAHSRVFDKSLQFLLAVLTFYMINSNVGFLTAAASPVATLGLSVICTFFPVTVTVIAATALILLHMYGVSLGVLGVTAVIFFVMYVFYFRLTPKMALVVLLMPVAFVLKVPLVIPLACALISTPVCMVAVACGTIVYYMMEYVKTIAPGAQADGLSGIITQVTAYIKQVFQNREMWIAIAAFMITVLVVYTIRRQSFNHAWKIALVAGAVVNAIVNAAGDIALGVHIDYVPLAAGSAAGIIVGLILELFFFAVDYSRTENLQFEDDEYYYYVKAVPKLAVASPEKTVKRISGREETEIMSPGRVQENRRDAGKHRERKNDGEKGRKHPEHRPAERRSADSRGKRAKKLDSIDEALVAKSLEEDLKR